MRVIKSDSGFLAYQKLFKHVVSNHSEMVLWQHDPASGRKISTTYMNSFHVDSALLHFDLPQEELIDSSLPIYCYAEAGQFIFKTSVHEMKSSALSLQFPQEVKLLEEPEIMLIRGQIGLDLNEVWRTKRFDFGESDNGDYLRVKSMAERSTRDQDFLNHEFESVSLDQEEAMFADKRESPRARPKIDKWVKLMVNEDTEIRLVRLFDLSRGGIGFLTSETQIFPKGAQIRVVGFEEFDLDDPLIGKIMSQRPIDDSMTEYKIGVKFDEGQD